MGDDKPKMKDLALALREEVQVVDGRNATNFYVS